MTDMLDVFAEPAFWASLVVLIGMEVALGADSAVLVSRLAARLPETSRRTALRAGMVLAALFRLALLLGVVWVLTLERTAFSFAGWSPGWRELVLLSGGLFLLYKAVTELHLLVEPPSESPDTGVSGAGHPVLVVLQIVLLNAVFSVDSILTAIALSPYVEAMAIAVVASVVLLYFAAEPLAGLLARHPSIKALAYGFLLLAGIVLVADGLGLEIVRSYLYAAMGFGVLVLILAKLARVSAQARRRPIERTEPVLEPRPDPQPEEKPVVPLGESAPAVPKSPRKRPVLRRRPARLRTGRRREIAAS